MNEIDKKFEKKKMKIPVKAVESVRIPVT